MVAFVDVQQTLEAAHQQSRANQEHERERYFGDHQRATQAVPRAADGCAAAAFLQSFVDVGARTKQGRRDAGQEPADHRNAEGK